MKDLNLLLWEDTAVERKYQILLKTIKTLQRVEESPSYYKLIQKMLPLIERNIETFERESRFLKEEIQAYVEAYRLFEAEYLKYQVWLVGNAEECGQVRAILNYDKVHLLGELPPDSKGGGTTRRRRLYSYMRHYIKMSGENKTYGKSESDKI